MPPTSWWAGIDGGSHGGLRPAIMTAITTGRLFYFVRHGETDWNAEHRLQGQLDIPLNALGRRQAAHCAEVLRRLIARAGKTAEDFAYVASPLSRARETMEILRDGLGLAV